MQAGVILLNLLLSLAQTNADGEGECNLSSNVNNLNDCKIGELTFVMIKPDAIQRGLVGEVVGRLERKGLQVVAMQLVQPTRELVEEHYKEHKNRSFFSKLVKYVSSGPVLAMMWRGREAVKVVRAILGATDPTEALAGTIRGDLALSKTMNLVHASDSVEAALRESELWLGERKVEWKPSLQEWLDNQN